jgi:hypothetical protein
MAVETQRDRLAMLTLGDWGVRAKYQNKGKRFDIIGIFDNDYTAVNVAENSEFASSTPLFYIESNSLPCAPVIGDKLIIHDEIYIVRNFRPDGTGITVLQLEVTLNLDPLVTGNLELETGYNILLENNMYLLQE